MHAFRVLVKQCGFIDLGYSGPAYTWTNRRYTSKPTLECLDRCLANADWCNIFPNSNVFNLPIIFSDHAPILLSTDGQYRKPKRNFKFENWWLMENDFHVHAKNVWSSSKNKLFHNRITNLAGALRKWCRKKKPIQQELDYLGEQIRNIQMQPTQVHDFPLEASLVSRYEQNMVKLTEYYQQRAKKHWAINGDRNTTFFHHAVLKRRRKNRIASIKDDNNVVHVEPDAIANVFIQYFKNLFSSSNNNHGRPYIHSGRPSIEGDYTYSVPDKKEIWETLRAMRRNASPGPDGFNVAFYIGAWDWIGDDIVKVVRDFYEKGTLPAHLNDTQITLIPKKLVSLVPADFRPISLCNVIYKIIAKTLANRLKPHLTDYIDQSQQAFIEG